MITMFKKIMSHFHISTSGCKSKVSSGAHVNVQALNKLARTRKTKEFSDLDHTPDESFGKLIKELSKE